MRRDRKETPGSPKCRVGQKEMSYLDDLAANPMVRKDPKMKSKCERVTDDHARGTHYALQEDTPHANFRYFLNTLFRTNRSSITICFVSPFSSVVGSVASPLRKFFRGEQDK